MKTKREFCKELTTFVRKKYSQKEAMKFYIDIIQDFEKIKKQKPVKISLYLLLKSCDIRDIYKTARIILKVCKFMDINWETLLSESRKIELVNTRYICYYFITKMTKNSTKKIGMIFNRDHATVLHGCKKIENFIDIYHEWDDKISKLNLIL